MAVPFYSSQAVKSTVNNFLTIYSEVKAHGRFSRSGSAAQLILNYYFVRMARCSHRAMKDK